jgi:hypothetical protein
LSPHSNTSIFGVYSKKYEGDVKMKERQKWRGTDPIQDENTFSVRGEWKQIEISPDYILANREKANEF